MKGLIFIICIYVLVFIFTCVFKYLNDIFIKKNDKKKATEPSPKIYYIKNGTESKKKKKSTPVTVAIKGAIIEKTKQNVKD